MPGLSSKALLQVTVTWWAKSATWTEQITTRSMNRTVHLRPQLRPCAYLFCQPWIRLVYLLSTPSSCLLRACSSCCCRLTPLPCTVPRPPPAPAEPPREPEPGLCEPLRLAGFLGDEEELVLLVPGLQSVFSILASGLQKAGGGGRGEEGGWGWSRRSSL